MRGSPSQIPVSQIAIVVADLEASMAEYGRRMGWGPWSVFEYRPPRFHDARVRGKPASFTFIGAETEVAGLNIELLQPLEGSSPYREWLDQHGEGLHHIGYWAPSLEAAQAVRQALAPPGTEALIEGWMEGVYFCYMETKPVLTEVWAGDVAALRPDRIVVGEPRVQKGGQP